MTIPKHLLESKIITDEQWEEYQRLKEENQKLKEYIKIANILEWFKGNNTLEKLLEEKKIPEKLEIYESDDETIKGLRESINIMFNDTASRINSIIDYLKSKGE